jgi:hypothetical protein
MWQVIWRDDGDDDGDGKLVDDMVRRQADKSRDRQALAHARTG